jgi:hypothetical protein
LQTSLAVKTILFIISILILSGPGLANNVTPSKPSADLISSCEAMLLDASRTQSWADKILDTLNPAALVMNKVLGVSHRKLAPPTFFMPSEKGLVLGINGVKSDETYFESADYMTGHSFQIDSFVQQSRVSSPADLIFQLKDYYYRFGPIYKLAIAAHGESGKLSIGGVAFDSGWIEKNKWLIETLPDDLFAENAIIVLISCSTAQGNIFSNRDGAYQLRLIFSSFAKRGAKVIASTRYVDPELAHIPNRYTTILDRVVRHVFVCPIGGLLAACELPFTGMRTWLKKVIDIEIPPAL